jgi:hypothetical protein
MDMGMSSGLDTGMAEPGADLGGNDLGAVPPEDESDLDSDEFNATDAAVGGSNELGRTRR